MRDAKKPGLRGLVQRYVVELVSLNLFPPCQGLKSEDKPVVRAVQFLTADRYRVPPYSLNLEIGCEPAMLCKKFNS